MVLAYPELHAWFGFLNGGITAGAAWRALVGSYVKKLGPTRARSLLDEVVDAAALVGFMRRDLETLCCVLGLDAAVLVTENIDAQDVLDATKTALDGLK